MTTEKEVTLNAHNKAEYPPMHTCEHILNQTMVRMFGCERSRNAHIERKKSKINYDLADEPTEEQIAEIARKVNEVIAADLPVTYAYVSRDAVPDNVPLDKLPDAAEDTLRLVRVGDWPVPYQQHELQGRTIPDCVQTVGYGLGIVLQTGRHRKRLSHESLIPNLNPKRYKEIV